MQHKQYQAHNQGRVNESGGYVKREKSKQPKNNQNYGDYSKHVFLSPCFCARESRGSKLRGSFVVRERTLHRQQIYLRERRLSVLL
jgi:hypothetical protein